MIPSGWHSAMREFTATSRAERPSTRSMCTTASFPAAWMRRTSSPTLSRVLASRKTVLQGEARAAVRASSVLTAAITRLVQQSFSKWMHRAGLLFSQMVLIIAQRGRTVKCSPSLRLCLCLEIDRGVGHGHHGHQDGIQEGRNVHAAGLFVQVLGQAGCKASEGTSANSRMPPRACPG